MHHYFLLTYSVDNIGDPSDERIANSVRDKIAELTLEEIGSMDINISFAIDGWEKLGNVETAISGMMWFDEEQAKTVSTKKAHARSILRSIFRSILRAKRATPDTTVIQCAMIISGAGETFTFKISPSK